VFNTTKRIFSIVLVTILFITAATYNSSQAVQNSTSVKAEQIDAKGLGNFYKVSDDIYRGKQPSAEGIAHLKEMGIKTIINLRTTDTDAKLLKKYDFNYVMIPMKAKNPQEEDVVKFLKTVADKNNGPVFVHCMRGADRTGFMCAMYRIVVQNWTKEAAIDEMINGGFKFSPLCKNLADYINKLDIDKIRKEVNTTQASN
jgi:protein tyrosine/serine phosphatase